MAKRGKKKKGGLLGTVFVLVIAAGIFLWQQEDYRQIALSWLDDTFHETTKDSSQPLSDGNVVQNVEGEAKIFFSRSHWSGSLLCALTASPKQPNTL